MYERVYLSTGFFYGIVLEVVYGRVCVTLLEVGRRVYERVYLSMCVTLLEVG